MTSKYEKLSEYLRGLPADTREVTLSFKQIESILDNALPKSAIDYRQWWANQLDSKNRPQAHAWMGAGFKVSNVQLKKPGGWVCFKPIPGGRQKNGGDK